MSKLSIIYTDLSNKQVTYTYSWFSAGLCNRDTKVIPRKKKKKKTVLRFEEEIYPQCMFLFPYLKIGQSFAWSLSLSQLCTDCQNNNVSLIWATLHSWNSDSELTATSTTKIIVNNFAFMLHKLHIQESKMLDWSACFWVNDHWAPK